MGAFTQRQRMENQASTVAKRNAKTLRIGMTDAERRLWSRLRYEQLGVKFRRQHPIGNYVLDFVCLDPKLVIEVDGSQHLDQQPYDERRSAWLASHGFAVVRFWANEVMSETDAVVLRLIEQMNLGARPAPTPTLPQWGRESAQGEQA
jgi:very-short-patch-repair endonuclease